GIDTNRLPILLPATEERPVEAFLVLSADTLTVTAIIAQGPASGDPLWQYRLTAPCRGRPTVVDQRLFIPTYDRKVHEIELAEGKPLGVYDLGQPLTVGGARQPGTSLVYFPADDLCVYVIDAAKREVVSILYSEHPSGTLRCEPVVVNVEEEP